MLKINMSKTLMRIFYLKYSTLHESKIEIDGRIKIDFCRESDGWEIEE